MRYRPRRHERQAAGQAPAIDERAMGWDGDHLKHRRRAFLGAARSGDAVLFHVRSEGTFEQDLEGMDFRTAEEAIVEAGKAACGMIAEIVL